MIKDLLEKNIDKENVGTVKKNLLHQLKKENKQMEVKSLYFFAIKMSQIIKNKVMFLPQPDKKPLAITTPNAAVNV